MTIGDRVKELRTKKGLTQQDLAELLGYKTKSSVAHIEKGRDIPRAMVQFPSPPPKTIYRYFVLIAIYRQYLAF